VSLAVTVHGVSESATERHGRLVGIKLRALVGDHLGRMIDAQPAPFAPGAALLVGRSAWVFLETEPERRLGSALAWAIRHDADELHVVAEAGTGTLARRAAEFTIPISVWHAEGRLLLPAIAAPVVAPVAADAEHLRFNDLIVEAGATPVVEHGVVFGEVRGLEVCRVVGDPNLGTVRLEVGVGPPDREAFQLIHGDVPPVEALARVVDAVTKYRDVDVPQHPLNRVARERFLRWRLEQAPDLVGAVSLAPVAPPIPRRNVNDVGACSAIGLGATGHTVLAVCSTGVDLDVIPYAADARLAATGGGAVVCAPGVGEGVLHVVVALPSRDLVPLAYDLAARLVQSVELVPVD
jgi:hypothetical protein